MVGRMSQTRRLAEIFAANVAGYSRLIGVDEGTHHDSDALISRGRLVWASRPRWTDDRPQSREGYAGLTW
jgi:hypothetical protein